MKIKEEELKTIYPNTMNIIWAQMPEAAKEEYLEIYTLYRKLLTEYMCKKINLKKYDEEIKNSDLNFKNIYEDKMDIYQKASKDYLKYLYIRNNVYIERLTEGEKQILMQKIQSKNTDLDDATEKLIQETYKKVIFEDISRNGSNCITMYGPDSSSFMSRNDALVIGVRYDEFYSEGMSDREWDKLHDRQLIFLEDLEQNLWETENNKLEVPLSIFKYNEFSVRLSGGSNQERKEEEER